MDAILGISAYYHDSAAALIKNGEVIAAAQEERFTRIKHDAAYPKNAVKYVLDEAGLNLNDVAFVAFYDKPFLKFERLVETYISRVPYGFKSFRMAIPLWLKEKLFQKDMIGKELKRLDSTYDYENKLLFGEHHFSHAASAFYPSPFEEAVVLTLDGVGEWATTTVSVGNGSNLEIVREIHFPHSLGLLYSAFTYYTGFKVNSGEYKLMGLAPYGQPKFKDIIFEKLIDVKEDGSFRLNQQYFNYATGLTMTNKHFESLFGHPVRKPESDALTQFHMDIAASIQEVIEDIIIKLTRSLAKEFKIPNLCLAGGVALNCVANGKILKDQAFKHIWIQPASGDAGGALGAALAAWHMELKHPREIKPKDAMKGAFLGPSFNQDQINSSLDKLGAKYRVLERGELISIVAKGLSEGKAVGFFQGRMEFGPRALGGRSIIADPRSPSTQKNLNLKVKFRESFRPFAPSILAEKVSDYFDLNQSSPYMLLVAKVKEALQTPMSKSDQALFGIEKLNVIRSTIPAVTHVDYSARIQTVSKEMNPYYYSIIEAFEKLTGCSLLVNTSFNVRGEPIVCNPEDAFRCFMGTDIEILVVEDAILYKEEQDPSLAEVYKDKFDLD